MGSKVDWEEKTLRGQERVGREDYATDYLLVEIKRKLTWLSYKCLGRKIRWLITKTGR